VLCRDPRRSSTDRGLVEEDAAGGESGAAPVSRVGIRVDDRSADSEAACLQLPAKLLEPLVGVPARIILVHEPAPPDVGGPRDDEDLIARSRGGQDLGW
jgi:hypothetical protein